MPDSKMNDDKIPTTRKDPDLVETASTATRGQIEPSAERDEPWYRRDRFFTDFLQRIGPELAATFSEEQLAAIKAAYGVRFRNLHPIDVRQSISIFWQRFYIVLLFGKEIRSPSRLKQAQATYRSSTTRKLLTYLLIGMIAVLAARGAFDIISRF